MTMLHEKRKKASMYVGVGVAKTIKDLSIIRDPGCAVAFCQRQINRNILDCWQDLIQAAYQRRG